MCRSNSRRKATIKLAPAMGTCSRCGGPYGNPLTHTCRPKSDFRSRKTAFGRKAQARSRARRREAERQKQRDRIAAARQRERERSRVRIERLKARHRSQIQAERDKARNPAPKAARPRRPPHEYQACADADCQRPLCAAFKAGYQLGDQEGHERGWQEGYDRGFPDGIDACPRAHQ